ncbi:MAG: hypothetical protein Q9182_006861 [Xanthomendoza sp. 2 TL-2023]
MGNRGSTVASNQHNPKNRVAAPTSCPVDEEARKAWLEAARKNNQLSKEPSASSIPISEDERRIHNKVWPSQTERNKIDHAAREPQRSQPALVQPNKASPNERPRQQGFGVKKTVPKMTDSSDIRSGIDSGPILATNRVTSTIPRADMAPSTTTPDPRSMPSPEGADQQPGNWIYPSEKMFFEAMKRKSFSPDKKDMSSIVPIHNAVNERAWSMIKTWESSSARVKALNASCGGPKLRSFSGDAAKLSPKARVLGWMGYQAPFDRHDWVVERCQGGGSVEYVIDFYKGRGDGLAFYLDVRPKLNTWEGCRMRIGSWVGLT